MKMKVHATALQRFDESWRGCYHPSSGTKLNFIFPIYRGAGAV